MKNKGLFLIIIIIFSSIFELYSQSEDIFSPDSLISELKEFYDINDKDLSKDVDAFKKDSAINILSTMWLSKVKRNDKKMVSDILNYEVSNNFNKEKTIWISIKSIILFIEKQNTNFSAWLSMLSHMIRSDYVTSSEVQKLITDVYYLQNDNYLCVTTTTKWKLSEGSYHLTFDSKNNILYAKTSKGTIEAYSDDDTIKIINTEGKYNVLKSVWNGENGKITWEKYNFPVSKINVNMNRYSINMRKPGFTADSVSFTNTDILEYPILGKITHEASKIGFKNNYFPLFRSYENNYRINSDLENIQFISGIEMQGATLNYVGTDSIPAIAEYYKDGTKIFSAQSKNFASLDKHLRSDQCGITIYIAENDSIIHPNANMHVTSNTFSFSRNPKGTGNRPFTNSYQKMDITIDNIYWNIGDTLIMFYSRSGNVAEFKSVDYFTKQDFTKHKMYELTNPLFDLKKITIINNSRSFYAADFARFVKKKPSAVVHRLMGFWYEGFIEYNPETQYVTVKEKLYDYIKYFFEKKDYDVINIVSNGVKSSRESSLYPIFNGFYNTNTNQLTVTGVEQVIINKRKKVGFVPENKTFVIGENRNMYFSGRLRVGLADFFGKDFVFNYEEYDINFTKGDSLIYRVWDKDLSETEETVRAKFVQSTVENISGQVIIDHKSNKSGAKEIAQFPKFICNDTSFVYYDKRNKQGNVYSRDDFYFRNDPFEHDSLLYMKKDDLKIPGMMFAGIIFPKFRDTLSVQNDYSLGFIHATANDGISLFNGKVSLSAQNSSMKSFIKLSNEGLEANGVAKWNNTTITTRDFNLYPDSLTALADEVEISEFINEETYAEFPEVKGKLINTRWDALNDVVRYETTGIPVDMYGEKVKFSGVFEYRPKSLTGKGDAVLDEGTVSADDIFFNKESFFSEKADLVIREDKSKDQDVIVKNMKAFVDIKSSKAVFQEIEGEDSHVEFVTNEYLSYPNHLLWYTGQKKINMNYNMNKYTNPILSKEEVLLDSTFLIDACKFDKSLFIPAYGDLKFVSTNKDQDSLMFFGSRANYFTDNKKLIAKDVQRIMVADIVVTPSSDVIITENGEMEKLLKTTVRARGIHSINDVDIKINSSNNYVASSGIYQYEDMNNELQNINFDNITYDMNLRASVAHGFIEQYQNFTLNPWFEYYGDVFFNARKDQLKFEGYAKLVHTCSSKPKWFYFKTDINPDSVYIPLEPKLHSDLETNRARIFADIMSSPDSTYTFPVFLSTDPYGNSESLISLRDSSFYVRYNQNKNRYEITTLEKFRDNTMPGNYMDMSRSHCIVNGEGKIVFTNSIRINDMGSYGNLRFDTNSGDVTMETLIYLDFFFNNKSLDILIENLQTNNKLNAVKINEPSYKKPMYEYLGIETTDKMLSEMSENLGKPRRFPNKLNKTLVFTNTDFKWDKESGSYKSDGKIGISNINNNMINKFVNGYIQIRKEITGDKMYIYLELNENEWYFFIFSGGIMRTISSNHEYNVAIESLKTKDKRIKTEKGLFNYMMTNNETKNNFIYEFTGVHASSDKFDDDIDDGSNDID